MGCRCTRFAVARGDTAVTLVAAAHGRLGRLRCAVDAGCPWHAATTWAAALIALRRCGLPGALVDARFARAP